MLRCEIQDGREPACVIGCEEGFTVCGTDPRDGCPISLTDTDYLYYEDVDGDGFAAPQTDFFCDLEAAGVEIQNPIAYKDYDKRDGNGVPIFDCDDTNDAIYPGAPNPCNGVDNSCSGLANDVDPNVAQVGTDCTINRSGVHGVCRQGQNICREEVSFVRPNYTGSPPSTVIVSIPTGSISGALGKDLTSPTHLQGLKISTQDYNPTEPRNCQPNIAMACDNCPGLRLRNVETQAGRAGAGRDATVPDGVAMNGRHPGNGSAGEGPSSNWSAWYMPGGSSPVGSVGGTASQEGFATHLGTDGIGPRGGAKGGHDSVNGKDGGGGVTVPQELALPWHGIFTPAISICVRAPDGTWDPVNHGGGGGGSWTHMAWSTVWGAGGGGGGEGGKPGYGGEHGGPSVGLLLYRTNIEGVGSTYDPLPFFQNVTFTGGQAGAGGAGTAGGNGGGSGDRGYKVATHGWAPIHGGFGGNGAGGNGGHGGKGGMSVGLVLFESVLSSVDGTRYVSGTGGAGGAGGAAGVQGTPNTSVTEIRAAEPGLPGPEGARGPACDIHDSRLGFAGFVLLDSQHCRQAP